jgi:flagellar biosynthesis repressor protein FlbT
MSLKIDLKPGEKFIVNGAVLKAGKRRVSLILENEAILLRSRDIMQEAEANTPARRIYFSLMLLYISGGDQVARARFDGFLNDFLGVTSLREIRAALLDILRHVENGKIYPAMKTCKWLIDVEAKLLKIATNRKNGDARASAITQEST